MASSDRYPKKRALIIGINQYPGDPLQYCINDAEDLKAALRRIGFHVTLERDCNLDEFNDTIKNFADKLHHDDLVLFYFAGHGKHMEDQTYLLPSDYKVQEPECVFIKKRAVSVQHILNKIENRKCCNTLYLFDCCRISVPSNKNQASSCISKPSQGLIVYTCKPDEKVPDETQNDRNGSFMENLLKYLVIPNKDVKEIMEDVARDVKSQPQQFYTQNMCIISSRPEKVYLVTNYSQSKNDFFLLKYGKFLLVSLCMNGADCFPLDPSLRDPDYDYDFTQIDDRGRHFERGGHEYHRSCGWKRFAINMIDKYEEEAWLGSSNSPDVWPVSYHGTGHFEGKTMEQIVDEIRIRTGFENGLNIYTTPDINVAKRFAKSYTFNGQQYIFIVQNRVNRKNVDERTVVKTEDGEYWISSRDTDVRPYGICVMKQSFNQDINLED